MLQEKILEKLKQSGKQVFSEKEYYLFFAAKSNFEKQELKKALTHLERKGEVVFDQKVKKYFLFDEKRFVKGVLESNEKGFAFIDNIPSESEGLFIAGRNLNGAFHKDTVIAHKFVRQGKPEGEIVAVLERGLKEIVGTFDKKGNTTFVIPDERKFVSDIYIPMRKDFGAVNGQKVIAKINIYPKNDKSPEGEVIGILGFPDDKGVDVLSVAAQYGIKEKFSENVEQATKRIPQEVTRQEISGRVDFRNDVVMTIDGEDTKDFDDAVSISKNANGTYRLGVHIADVEHYVKQSSVIDKEAYERGTSVYFPNAVFPMLPVGLSNGICSLNPHVDRLTLSCVMNINENGKVVSFEICESVIRSAYRLTYTEVTKIINGDAKLRQTYKSILKQIDLMNSLAGVLIKKRESRGALDFETKEVKFKFDANNKVEAIVPHERTISHKIIEEFMVLANETVAEFAFHLEVPFLYRVHEKPTEDKLIDLNYFLAGLGLSVKGDLANIHSSSLQKVLKSIAGKSFENIASSVMLRSMQKAKYQPTNLGHFGLGSKCYCHFTSPIRRYPDLVVHRVVKLALKGMMDEKTTAKLKQFVDKAGFHCTEREIAADKAERDIDDMKKAEYARKFIGKEFSGVISGVTSFGIFVELENTLEGLIHIDYLPFDRYEFNEKNYTLTGKNNKFVLGQKLNVIIANADTETKKIDFALA